MVQVVINAKKKIFVMVSSSGGIKAMKLWNYFERDDFSDKSSGLVSFLKFRSVDCSDLLLF
jgi:hypothetical protein